MERCQTGGDLTLTQARFSTLFSFLNSLLGAHRGIDETPESAIGFS